MTATLTNFLVGVGFDYDEDGAKKIGSGIDSIKSKALQAGAVIAGAFGANALTFGFADANAELGRFSETFGVLPDDVAALGRVLTREGGSLQEFMSQLGNIEKLRSNINRGVNTGIIGEAGRFGVEVMQIVNAKNATEAYLNLANQFQALSAKNRIGAAGALGLSEADIRVLSKGTIEVRQLMEAQRNLRPITEEMTAASIEFSKATKDLMTNIGGVADQISVRLLPEINKVIDGMNDWLAISRELFSQDPDSAISGFTKNVSTLGGTFSSGQQEQIGKFIAQTLAVFGNENAMAAVTQDAISQGQARVRNEQASLNAEPIVFRGDVPLSQSTINSQRVNVRVELNGPMIEKKIVDVIDQQNEQALTEIETSTGG